MMMKTHMPLIGQKTTSKSVRKTPADRWGFFRVFKSYAPLGCIFEGMEIVEKVYHPNGSCAPFVVAIVDDPADGDTKLVIMFEEPECTAVLSLDTLIESEDIGKKNSYSGERYEYALRDELWNDPNY